MIPDHLHFHRESIKDSHNPTTDYSNNPKQSIQFGDGAHVEDSAIGAYSINNVVKSITHIHHGSEYNKPCEGEVALFHNEDYTTAVPT